jgi:hypothetical protein
LLSIGERGTNRERIYFYLHSPGEFSVSSERDSKGIDRTRASQLYETDTNYLANINHGSLDARGWRGKTQGKRSQNQNFLQASLR